MEERKYLCRQCNAVKALKSRICKDLSKVEEIVSDLKYFFEANHDGVWRSGTFRSLYEAMSELDEHYQSLKSIKY